MRIQITARSVVMLAASMFTAHVPGVAAKSSFGPWVDSACRAYNGTQPYTEQSCGLCHTADLGQRVDPQWSWWENQTLTSFCPPITNAPPNGVIDLPAANQSIFVGEAVRFEGTATDPASGGGAGPGLTYLWNFDGGAPNSTLEDPGVLRFEIPGTFNITFTVISSLGVGDPTPDSRTIQVVALAPTCSDGDGDGFRTEGGACGPVDCNDAVAAINPGAVESCNDGIDNNCNGLVDIDDPVAVGCPTTVACTDEDRDGFRVEGGICGPVDCDDDDKAVTVQCRQDAACRAETACLEALFQPPVDVEVHLEEAEWDREKSRLRVEGERAPAGETVMVDNAGTDQPIGTTRVESDGEWRFERFNPPAAPCRVRVTIAGQSAERQVEDAPPNCDEPGSGQVEVRIEEAKWNRERSRLRVKGEHAPAGETVVVENAGTGEPLGTTRVEPEGEWRFERIDPPTVPCRVRVTIAGQSAERRVEDAPPDCDEAGTGQVDSDGDGVHDGADNCIAAVNGDQRDSDGDGYGNRCDADLNNDGDVNILDLGLFRSRFGSSDPDADFNGDGDVNIFDLGIFRELFLEPPGPSGVVGPVPASGP